MKELEEIAEELKGELSRERNEKRRTALIKKYLYKAYILGFSPFNLRKYERIDERYPKRDCRKP